MQAAGVGGLPRSQRRIDTLLRQPYELSMARTRGVFRCELPAKAHPSMLRIDRLGLPEIYGGTAQRETWRQLTHQRIWWRSTQLPSGNRLTEESFLHCVATEIRVNDTLEQGL